MIHQRPLTPAEHAALPAGLMARLPADIVLVADHHPLSRLSRLFRGYALIVVRHKRIFWPGLPDDLSRDPVGLSILAHELVHVWQYADGMNLFSYILRDVIGRLGRYAYQLVPGKAYTSYGYEQQAAMMEDWVRLSHHMPARYGRGSVKIDALVHLLPFV